MLLISCSSHADDDGLCSLVLLKYLKDTEVYQPSLYDVRIRNLSLPFPSIGLVEDSIALGIAFVLHHPPFRCLRHADYTYEWLKRNLIK